MNEDGVFCGEPEGAAEELHVAQDDVRASHDGNRLAGAIDAGIVERREVVDDGKIPGSQIVRAVSIRDVDRQLRNIAVMVKRKVMQRNHALHQSGKGARNARIGGVGVMGFAINFILADIGLERAFHLLHVAAEIDPKLAIADFFNAETKALQPVGRVAA